MRRIVFTVLFFFLFQFSASSTYARTNVVGSVGEFFLNISGYVSPYASIVLTNDKTFLRSTTADEKGNFSFTDVLIKKGFSGFCLTAVDFHRVGDSYTCFNVPPAEASISRENIFLPPTLGLSRSAIGPNESADAFGYTMPNAEVTLFLSNGEKITTNADKDGYYKFTLKNLPPGKYEIYSTAVHNYKESEAPSKKKEFESYSLGTKLTTDTGNFLKKLLTGLVGILLTFIWIAIPLFILLIILVLKPIRDKLAPFLDKLHPRSDGNVWQPTFDHLHHYWFIGY